ncbi:NTPase, partial [Campylobacter coli]|nr:NTPase [Campylobacter coli]EAK6970193.1 NTPase [Campylobacter coli]EAL5550990.1 NTPase [Campylobacter coli]ECZ2991161.1 NTPase [Campylobacter coli]EDI9896147.1 NTPase [Campylobacter coli]
IKNLKKYILMQNLNFYLKYLIN